MWNFTLMQVMDYPCQQNKLMINKIIEDKLFFALKN